MPAPTAADVGPKFDCLINGQGYLFADPQDIKAEFGYTPTFVTRQNTQGDYGDAQQDFWLTFTQRDWSLGDQQRYQGRDDEGKRRYWTGDGIDVRTVPGQVAIEKDAEAQTLGEAAAATTAFWEGHYFASTTHLYRWSSNTLTDLGAHGLGATPEAQAICNDNYFVYFSTTSGGTVGVRKCVPTAGTFSTFSATGANALAFQNNTLYGFVGATRELIRYDTAGAVTSLFQWKEAGGTTTVSEAAILTPYGGKLAIWLIDRAELWIYDGTAPAIAWQAPSSFYANQMITAFGQIFISGAYLTGNSALTPAVVYYANGTTGELWRKEYAGGGFHGGIAAFKNGVVWEDRNTFVDSVVNIMFWNPSTGGVSCVATYTLAGTHSHLSSNLNQVAIVQSTSTALKLWPHHSGTRPASSTVVTSLEDFDSSLTKLFRGIKLDFDLATDGNFGSVDISYRLNDADGSYTSLQTGAVSGTEYGLTNISGRSISVKVTLNKGTSTAGPILKRIYVRAVPVQPKYKTATYVLRIEGVKGRGPSENHLMNLRNDQPHNKDAAEMITDLQTAATSASAITIIDEANGSFTGIIDGDGFKIQKSSRGGFWATVPVRQI